MKRLVDEVSACLLITHEAFGFFLLQATERY